MRVWLAALRTTCSTSMDGLEYRGCTTFRLRRTLFLMFGFRTKMFDCPVIDLNVWRSSHYNQFSFPLCENLGMTCVPRFQSSKPSLSAFWCTVLIFSDSGKLFFLILQKLESLVWGGGVTFAVCDHNANIFVRNSMGFFCTNSYLNIEIEKNESG